MANVLNRNSINALQNPQPTQASILSQMPIGRVRGQLNALNPVTTGLEALPISGELMSLQRMIDELRTPVNPADYIRGNQFDMGSFMDANKNKGGVLGLEALGAIPLVGYGARGAGAFLKGAGADLLRPSMINQGGMVAPMAERVDKRVLAERRLNKMFDNVPTERRQAPRRQMAIKNEMTDIERQDKLLQELMARDSLPTDEASRMQRAKTKLKEVGQEGLNSDEIGLLSKEFDRQSRVNKQAFSRETTDMPFYDDLLKSFDSEYKMNYFKTQKGLDYQVLDISPKAYLNKVDSSFEHGVMSGVDKYRVAKYAEKIRNGEQFPMLTLDYSQGRLSQEGRHRALAAIEAGVNRVPVIEVRKID